MLSTLGLRLEDPDQVKFTQAAKLDALNIAQKTVVNLINNAYLTELQVIDTGETPASGELALSALTSVPIRNGVLKVYDDTDDLYCVMIEPGDVKRLENTYLAGSTTNPVCYVFNEKIFFIPDTIILADIWYLKEPADLAADATECEFNVALHELVVDFSESQLWKMDAKTDRAKVSYENAMLQIRALNERYEVEKPRGIGTRGNR